MFFNIQRWSLHDGPGIRTTIFFKGCPLRCQWCSNPESWDFKKQLLIFKNRCTACGTCAGVCPEKATVKKNKSILFDADKCTHCYRCVEVCPEGAREPAGLELDADDILKLVERDSVFYRSSGGGITFSGGEPFSQMETLSAIAEKCDLWGIDTAVETSGYFDLDKARQILEIIEHIYIDLKHMDDITHKQLTCASNQIIIQNIIDIDASGKKIALRIPLIKDVTDTNGNIRAIVTFARQLKNLKFIELLTYHNLAIPKYAALGIEYNSNIGPSERADEIKKLINHLGIKCL